jgi:hypothetical protein
VCHSVHAIAQCDGHVRQCITLVESVLKIGKAALLKGLQCLHEGQGNATQGLPGVHACHQPARYGSTRLPGKPLLDILGKPMVQRVWEQAQRSTAARVVIATDDARIVDIARAFGAEVCMTRPEHPSGTDRLQQVARELGLADAHIVVNVQGDEPLIRRR